MEEVIGVAAALLAVVNSVRTLREIQQRKDVVMRRTLDERTKQRISAATNRIMEIHSLYQDFDREQGSDLPEYAAADFLRTLRRTEEALSPLERLGKGDKTVKTELSAAVSRLEENAHALESIFQALVIQVNMAATAGLIIAIEEASAHPSLALAGQPTRKQQASEGLSGTYATDEFKQRFVLPSVLKFVGCQSFVYRLPILDVSSPKWRRLASSIRFTDMRLGNPRRPRRVVEGD